MKNLQGHDRSGQTSFKREENRQLKTHTGLENDDPIKCSIKAASRALGNHRPLSSAPQWEGANKDSKEERCSAPILT